MKLYPEVFNEYAATSGRLRTEKSRESFRYEVQKFQSLHPTKHITQFTQDDLTSFCIGEGSAPNTIRHRRTVLQAVFGWAEWKGYIKTNPASALKYSVSPGRHEVRKGNWLEEHELAVLIRSCEDDLIGRRNKLIILLGSLMGLRRDEIARLRWSQFTPDLRQLNLVGKGQKIATLGVPAQLGAELAAWRMEVPVGCDTVLPVTKETGLVGRSQIVEWDKPLGEDGIYNAVKTTGARCGLSVAPHDLRRSFAGMLETKGKPLTDIQRAMRHSNPGTTGIYLDKNPRKTVAVTEGLTIDY